MTRGQRVGDVSGSGGWWTGQWLDVPDSSDTAWLMAATAVPTMDKVSRLITNIAASFGFIAATLLTGLKQPLFYTRDSVYARVESGFESDMLE